MNNPPTEISLVTVDKINGFTHNKYEDLSSILKYISHSTDTHIISINNPTSDNIKVLAKNLKLSAFLVDDLNEKSEQVKLTNYENADLLTLNSVVYQEATDSIQIVTYNVITQNNNIFILSNDLPNSLFSNWTENIPLNYFDHTKGRPEAIIYVLLDSIVDTFFDAIRGLREDLNQIELQTLKGNTEVFERIYKLSSATIKMRNSVDPTFQVLDSFINKGFIETNKDEFIKVFLHSIRNHLALANTKMQELIDFIPQVISIYSSVVAEKQNDAMKKISSWGGILLVPTLISSIYGMNFQNMPELGGKYSYYICLAVMIISGLTLYKLFKKNNWL